MNMGATLDDAAEQSLRVGPLSRAATDLDEKTRTDIRNVVREALTAVRDLSRHHAAGGMLAGGGRRLGWIGFRHARAHPDVAIVYLCPRYKNGGERDPPTLDLFPEDSCRSCCASRKSAPPAFLSPPHKGR